jgi:uncharacterized protein (UPF0264 family)
MVVGLYVVSQYMEALAMPTLLDKDVKALDEQRQTWSDFFAALDRVAQIKPA